MEKSGSGNKSNDTGLKFVFVNVWRTRKNARTIIQLEQHI
jgi:hypothetical protein